MDLQTLELTYPRAGNIVSGLDVRGPTPNMESISASLYNYTILPGLREVSMSHFNADPHDLFYAANDHARVRELAPLIKKNRWIDPLIVVIDSEGPYILEGAHRLGALHVIGANSFPAVVVLDEDQGSTLNAQRYFRSNPPAKYAAEIGDKIQQLRVELGMSYRQFADKVWGTWKHPKAARQYESQLPIYEAGLKKCSTASLQAMKTLADAYGLEFNIPITWLSKRSQGRLSSRNYDEQGYLSNKNRLPYLRNPDNKIRQLERTARATDDDNDYRLLLVAYERAGLENKARSIRSLLNYTHKCCGMRADGRCDDCESVVCNGCSKPTNDDQCCGVCGKYFCPKCRLRCNTCHKTLCDECSYAGPYCSQDCWEERYH